MRVAIASRSSPWYGRRVTTVEQLRALYSVADGFRAPPDPGLYVTSPRAIADDLVTEIQIAPMLASKHLIYGARGSGKSSQIHEVYRGLRSSMTVVDVDLDRSGSATFAAIDLVYIVGLATLRHLPDLDAARPLHEALAKAYTIGDEAEQSALGRLDEALPGVVGFGEAAVAAATALAMATPPAAIAVAAVKGTMNLLRLRSKSPTLVTETSAHGRALQQALEAIFEAVRAAHGRRPIVVLIDGLERINGAAVQWMRDTFANTRLLTDTTVTMVIATPPCPFTETTNQPGWSPRIVYGFAPDAVLDLAEALRRRVGYAGIDPTTDGFGETCERLAIASGGHPRHAIQLLRTIAVAMLKHQRASVTGDDIEDALQSLREELAVGLTDKGWQTLRQLGQRHELPGSEIAANLFVTERILVHPASRTAPHSFHVHPLLLPWVQTRAAGADGVGDE